METISVQNLSKKLQAGESIELVDVRTPVEFREVHVTVARNVPLDSLRIDPAEREQSDGDVKPLYVICRSGNRSTQACQKLEASGHRKIINVEGGTSAWESAGLPVVRGKKTISLERQVRIAAGALTFTGAALGYFVHPYWIGLSAFVGAGLMFAGITDSCAMGMMLAKMPWNQVSCKT